MQTVENDFDHVSQFVTLESVVRNVAPQNRKYLYGIPDEECQFQLLESSFLTSFKSFIFGFTIVQS